MPGTVDRKIVIGTRFVATRESMAAEMYKKALLERSGDATTLTDAFSGRYVRALRNAFTDGFEAGRRFPAAPHVPPVHIPSGQIWPGAAALVFVLDIGRSARRRRRGE